MQELLFCLLGLVLFIIGVILISIGNKIQEKNDDKIPKKDTTKIIIGSIMLLLGISLSFYFGYKFYNDYTLKSMAEKLLIIKDKVAYDELCNNLFKKGSDETTYNQYIDMKKTRSSKEVDNLCGNFSKGILSRK